MRRVINFFCRDSKKKLFSGIIRVIMLTINPFGINNNFQNRGRRIGLQKSVTGIPSFGYRVSKIPVGEPKNIHKLVCGCCGQKMLTKSEKAEFLKSFLAGSKRALEHPVIKEKYKDTPEYNFLSVLSEIAPKKTIRELIELPENKAKLKTLEQKTQLGINFIAVLSEGITVKAPRVLKKLSKYYDNFSKEDREILDLMEVYSLKYPKKTFSEIFMLPEVFEIHQKQYNELTKQCLAQRAAAFKKVRELLPQFPNQKDVPAFQKAHLEVVHVLNNSFYRPHIKKGLVNEIYGNFLKEHPQNRKITRRIHSIAASYPYEGGYTDKFIVNAVNNRKSDLDIVKGFVEELQSTFEHVVLKSKKGSDNLRNGIYLCKKCNNERSNLPYPFFLRFHPEMKINLQKQLNKIITYIRYGKLPNYETYPMDIKQTIWQETDHTIKLKINEYLKFRKEQAMKRLEVSKAVIAEDDKKLLTAAKSLEEIDAKLEEVMAVIRKLKKKKRSVRADYDEMLEQKILDTSTARRNETDLKFAEKDIEHNEITDRVKAKRISKIKE